MLSLFQQRRSMVNKKKTEFASSAFQMKVASNIASEDMHCVVSRMEFQQFTHLLVND
jgi:hypothetical protein